MTRVEFQALLDCAAAGWANGDAAAVGDCFAEDVEYIDPFVYRFTRRGGARCRVQRALNGHRLRRPADLLLWT